MPTKYQKNLKVEDDKVYSYNEHVATIKGKILTVFSVDHSMTTTKHINYVAKDLGLIKRLQQNA